jgi:DNA-binding LacI/PurR family transcriptional regulator
MAVTIHDVARVAGVSIKTVSRTLNEDKHVRSETRERVLAAMRQLHYSPDPAARSLRGKTLQTIGVVVGHSPDVVFSNPFFAEVLRGIGRTAASLGYKVILMTYSPEMARGELIDHHLVDGFILMSLRPNDPLAEYLRMSKIPFVCTSRQDSGDPYVDVDNILGAQMAVQHLLALGHRRIGLINGPAELTGSRDRHLGYQKALAEAGVPYDPDLVVHTTFSDMAGHQAVQHFWRLPEIPTALFVTADLMAMGAMRGVNQCNLSIPDDIAIVGFDGVGMGQYMNPPLTTINQQGERKGTVAAELLICLLNNDHPRPDQITLTPELIVRGSTAPVHIPVPRSEVRP